MILDRPNHPKGKDEDWQRDKMVYAGYRISPKGLTRLWEFDYIPDRVIDYRAAHKTVIRDGILYGFFGPGRKKERHLCSFDMSSGKLIFREPQQLPANILSQPTPVEDKLYIVIDGAHSGSFAGLIWYQLEDGGRRFRRLGRIKYKYLGIERMDGYGFLKTTPYYNGRVFMRGLMGVCAVDLRTVTDPMAKLNLKGAWAGSPVPVRCRMFADSKGVVQTAKARPPAGGDLGVIHTTGRRRDGWTRLVLDEQLNIRKGGSVTATLDMISHSWDAQIALRREKGQWAGTWKRTIPAWDRKPTMKGKITDGRDGYDAKVFPTPWLRHQPMTKMGDLPKGQQRVILTLPDVLPKGGRAHGDRPLTLCLDHDGEKFVTGVGGEFSFNQSWHEVDLSGLKLTDEGFNGTLLVIVNPDPWWAPNQEKGTAIVGRVKIDARFGKKNDEGLRPVKGEWAATWGESLTRTGKIDVTFTDPGE
jgi:hypothetical protein